MPDSLPALEAQRSQILHQISALGDLRPGSISAVVLRCGKPTCHCAKPDDPGRDPQLRLTRTVNGAGITAEVRYAGSSPTAPSGVFQVNFVVPPLGSYPKTHTVDIGVDTISTNPLQTVSIVIK